MAIGGEIKNPGMHACRRQATARGRATDRSRLQVHMAIRTLVPTTTSKPKERGNNVARACGFRVGFITEPVTT
jgi:hypothetical protein